MRAVLRNISNDNFDLETFIPEELDSFNILLLLSIGPENENGINYFYLRVCTPEWYCKHQWIPELIRNTLLVRKYDLNEIKKTITDYIDQSESEDWMQIAQKLSRVFDWEYEDYEP